MEWYAPVSCPLFCPAGSYTVSCFGLSLSSQLQPPLSALQAAASAASGDMHALLPVLPPALRALLIHLLSPACLITPGLLACSTALVLQHGGAVPEGATAAVDGAVVDGVLSVSAFRTRQRQLLAVIASVR